MGLRIKGAFTRNEPGKSFNLFAKQKYGKSTIETDLLKDNYDIKGNLISSYKTLSLRNVFDEDRIRDKYGRDLYYMRKDLTSTSTQNSVVFLNGEYWGFYLIQEKVDNSFISNNYLLPSKNIVMAKSNKIQDGPGEEYDNFKYFCGNYSLKDVGDKKVYSEIEDYIDINSLIELYATGIYISNLDWPGNNDGEWKYLGEPIEGNKFSDGKWRFMVYDLDYSMGADFHNNLNSPEKNNFEAITTGRRRGAPLNLFLSLIKNNADFQNKFANIICDYANDVYNIERVNVLIEKYRDECTDLMAYSRLRWGSMNFYSTFEGYAFYKNSYHKSLDSMYNFFEERPKYILQHMKNYINLKEELVDLIIEIKGRGKVQINSITPKFKNNVWIGKYFTNVPIIIKAISDDRYNFIEWDGIFQSNKRTEEIMLSTDNQKIIAVFN